jgi:antitoxin ParD1/3/4
MDLTTLPDEVKELVRAQLEAGRFQSVDEVVVEALRLLQEREELFASHREQLRAQIAEGVASAPAGRTYGAARSGGAGSRGHLLRGPRADPAAFAPTVARRARREAISRAVIARVQDASWAPTRRLYLGR